MEGVAAGGCANTIPRARVVPASTLPRWALVADAVATALFVLPLAIVITGGFVITEEVRLSARFAGRPFLLGCVVAGLRFYFARQPSPLLTRLFRPRRLARG
jgi:hypothetical protein